MENVLIPRETLMPIINTYFEQLPAAQWSLLADGIWDPATDMLLADFSSEVALSLCDPTIRFVTHVLEELAASGAQLTTALTSTAERKVLTHNLVNTLTNKLVTHLPWTSAKSLKMDGVQIPKEALQPVMAKYLDTITEDQWRRLAAGNIGADTEMLLADLCSEIVCLLSRAAKSCVTDMFQERQFCASPDDLKAATATSSSKRLRINHLLSVLVQELLGQIPQGSGRLPEMAEVQQAVVARLASNASEKISLLLTDSVKDEGVLKNVTQAVIQDLTHVFRSQEELMEVLIRDSVFDDNLVLCLKQNLCERLFPRKSQTSSE